MPRGRKYDMARMRRDMRNPYGSRGGYVVSDRRGRDMRARRDMRGRDYVYGMGDMVRDREHDARYDYRDYGEPDYAERRSYSQQPRQSYRNDMGYDYHYGYESPYMTMPYSDYNYRGDYRRYAYDRGPEIEYLTDEELMDWSRELLRDVEEKDKSMMTREHITQRAKDMGAKFKDYTEDELVVATLMAYTDYKKTLGTGNVDLYIRLGKDWLEDEDSELKGGEKLAAYYDEVICAE